MNKSPFETCRCRCFAWKSSHPPRTTVRYRSTRSLFHMDNKGYFVYADTDINTIFVDRNV